MTVTLHDPALRPLSVEPTTLQYFALLVNTFSESFDVEETASLAKVAMDLAVADLELVIVGADVATDGVATAVD